MINRISSDRQFFTITELRNHGLSNYQIRKLVKDGELEKLNNKVYRNISYNGDESDFSTVNAYAPKGVVCLLSAARYYNLTSYMPDSVDIAIERDMKISTIPDWPSINIWYFPKKRYEANVVTSTDYAGTFRVYDIEKTVADILYYRNKVGIEETKEILTKYLSRSDRNLVKLHRLSKSMGCEKILSTYLEVLL